jgi:uncharacterized membrane protein YeiB
MTSKMKTRKLIILVLALATIVIAPNVIYPVSAQTSQNVINQLESDINDAKNTANNAAQSYARVAQSFQEVKDTTDKLYMISMAGIGIGVAGIVIAVFAISRKGEKI